MTKLTKELALLLSLFLIAAALQSFAQSLPMALCFYFLPTMYSAYFFGRRHATLTAFTSVLLVMSLNYLNALLPKHYVVSLPQERLFNFAIWAGVLAVTGYAMGTLYERAQGMTNDLRNSFSSLLLVLQHVIVSEKRTDNESQRVIDIAIKIAETLDLGPDRMDLLRSAILLRDLSELGISNDTLYKAADVTHEEVVASLRKGKSDQRTESVGNAIRRVVPIIVAEQILQDQGARASNIPIEAHILAVADAYQKLTNSSYGKPHSPQQAEEEIMAGAGDKYDRGVVAAFVKAFGERARGANA
ncbi:MAG TPA: HD domain-containing phosphohydrolase [Terriglobales bacterium]|nr:HD domain-containing phosphohydrolase [Terriglobales bacterium]